MTSLVGPCDARQPIVACFHRRWAIITGRFAYRSGHGWVWADSRHPEQTWELCPWCGGSLPDLDTIAQARAQADGIADAFFTGDGPE